MRHLGRLRPSGPRALAMLAAFSTLLACAGARLQVHASGAEVPLSFSGSLPDEHMLARGEAIGRYRAWVR